MLFLGPNSVSEDSDQTDSDTEVDRQYHLPIIYEIELKINLRQSQKPEEEF
jgi:hypothetical protein